MRRILACLSCAVLLAAAEPLPRPDLPDPFGLGERLVLLEHLREQWRLTPPPDATYEQLVALYWKAKGRPVDTLAGIDDAALARDRLRRLRSELQQRHGITAPEDEGEEALRQRLAAARTADGRRMAADAARVVADDARDGLRASEAGNVQARLDRAGGEIRQLQERLARLTRQREALVTQAQEAMTRKSACDGAVSGALLERNRWMKAADDETRSVRMVAPTTRDNLDKAKQAYRAAVDAVNAVVEELDRLRMEHERQGEEQARIQARIAVLDRERLDDAARLAPVRPAAEVAPGNPLEDRLRAAVVLVVAEGRGSGTGFLVGADGLLITNAHVVGDGMVPMVALWDAAARRGPARLQVVRIVAEDDLALLRAEGTGFAPLALAEVYELSRPLVAVGFPLAGGVSRALGTSPADIVVTRGTLSAVRRQGERIRWLQHDCRIASGSSGGPLVDPATGAVVGVNALVLTPGGQDGAGDGMNLAIPTQLVRARFGGLLAGAR